MDRPLGSERDRPLYFAGRREELAKLSERLDYIKCGDPSGGMTLIDGIQGIGKTQLMMEFVRRACAKDAGVTHFPLTTRGLPADPAELFAIFTEALLKPPTSKTNTTTALVRKITALPRKITALARNLKRIPVGIGTVELRERHRLLDNLLRESRAKGWWAGRALILTVDEVQSIDAEGRSTLRILHEGSHGCPIMVVAAGLQHARSSLAESKTTRDGVVRDDAISRFAMVLTLGMLSREETIEAVVESVAATGEGTMPADLAGRIADASMGFPQHVHGYIDASIRVLRARSSLNTAAAREETVKIGDQARRRFYELRLTSLDLRHQLCVVELATAMRSRHGVPTIDWNEAVAVVERKLADGSDGVAVIESAVQKGVLSASPGTLTFPIPSFHDYVLSLVEDGVRQAQS